MLLVGYDDIPLARYVEPALTSVQGDMAEVGSVAAVRLLELIGGRRPDALVTSLPTDLVVRNSCGCGVLPSAAAHRGPAGATNRADQQSRHGPTDQGRSKAANRRRRLKMKKQLALLGAGLACLRAS